MRPSSAPLGTAGMGAPLATTPGDATEENAATGAALRPNAVEGLTPATAGFRGRQVAQDSQRTGDAASVRSAMGLRRGTDLNPGMAEFDAKRKASFLSDFSAKATGMRRGFMTPAQRGEAERGEQRADIAGARGHEVGMQGARLRGAENVAETEAGARVAAAEAGRKPTPPLVLEYEGGEFVADPKTGLPLGQEQDPFADDGLVAGIDAQIAGLQEKMGEGENRIGFLNTRSIRAKLEKLQKERQERVQELSEFDSEEAAMASGLPSGTIVTINGRQAKIK